MNFWDVIGTTVNKRQYLILVISNIQWLILSLLVLMTLSLKIEITTVRPMVINKPNQSPRVCQLHQGLLVGEQDSWRGFQYWWVQLCVRHCLGVADPHCGGGSAAPCCCLGFTIISQHGRSRHEPSSTGGWPPPCHLVHHDPTPVDSVARTQAWRSMVEKPTTMEPGIQRCSFGGTPVLWLRKSWYNMIWGLRYIMSMGH